GPLRCRDPGITWNRRVNRCSVSYRFPPRAAPLSPPGIGFEPPGESRENPHERATGWVRNEFSGYDGTAVYQSGSCYTESVSHPLASGLPRTRLVPRRDRPRSETFHD